MRKFIALFLFASALLLFGNPVFSQPGSSCSTPFVITALPFNSVGMTTNGFPDIFENTDACGSNYMTGNDFIFSYTPAMSQYVNIALSNTGIAVGLFITDSCPSLAGATCVAMNEAIAGNPFLTDILLQAGHTYYIIVSTWDPGVIPNPSTAFDIQMTSSNPEDLAISGITNPLSGCGLSASENITITITNIGLTAVDSLLVEYKINNGTPVTDTVYSSILPSSTVPFTFSVPGDFSVAGMPYNLVVYLKTPDSITSNDTAHATITNSPVINTFPYFENFETNNGGYGTSGTNTSWAWGTPNKSVITHASSPVKCWVTNLSGSYNQGEASYLNFPCLDFTTLTAPVLDFDIWVSTSGLLDYCRVDYSTDGGTTWHTLGQQNDPINWYDGANGWTSPISDFINVRHRMDMLAGNPNAKLRIYFYGSIISQTDGIAVDNIKIYQAPANDLAVTGILYPGTACGLDNNEQIQVTIENFGTAAQSNFNVGFSINGAASTTEIVMTTLNAGASMQYTYTTPANLSAVQQYQINCYPSLSSDGDHSNDTASVTINNLLGISVYPYHEDFESSDGGWVGGGLNSSWAWGSPIKPTINHAASPTKCWVTNLTTNANMMEMSNLMGPCFDFTTLTVPEIEFNIWYSTTSMAPGMDSIILQVSIDSGISWSRVGQMNDPYNWYNTAYGWSGNSATWLHVKHTLAGAGGEGNVRIRLSYYGPYASICEGVAIDDIYIHEATMNDMGTLQVNMPASGCNLSGSEYIGIQYSNFGQNAQSHFPVSYQINGGTWKTDTVMFPIYYGETVNHVFSQTTDMSAFGNYTIKATTGLVNDEDHANDTIMETIVHSAGINTLPYTEDFEADNGDWYTEGTSSWAWGVPVSTVINTAHSPTKAWKTNLAGNALTGEESYLYSPCLDLTNYSNPFIELYVWHETTPMMGSSAVLEASTDGGSFYSVVGPTDLNNWYTTDMSSIYGWTGSSASWVYKVHALDFCGSQSGVKLRIHYRPGQFSMVPEEGIAIDDIHIFDCILPNADFTSSVTGATVNFTNSSTNATSYLWKFGDGTTSTLTNTSHIYAANGTYSVTLLAYNNCGADSTTQTVTITADGIEDLFSDKNITYTPNPNHGTFILTVNKPVAGEVLIEIFSLTGSKVYSETMTADSETLTRQIDLTSFGKGVYYLQLRGKDINVVRKVVVD